MIRITKKEAVFFVEFSEMIELALQASQALEDLMADYTNIEAKIKTIATIEHNCDVQVHKIIKQLNAAFITPIDREDIFLIAKEIDNIVDYIDETANHFTIYNVKKVRPAAIELSKLITQSITNLQIIFVELIKMKANDKILQPIIEVNRIENLGDEIYRAELTKLFAVETDAIEVIRWQGIYNYLEIALDSCEDVANIIEGVVMKHA